MKIVTGESTEGQRLLRICSWSFEQKTEWQIQVERESERYPKKKKKEEEQGRTRRKKKQRKLG